MAAFDPKNPFPLLAESEWSYAAEKEHATQADAWLGLEVDRVESGLAAPTGHHRLWIGTPPAIFLTPYCELRRWLTELAPTAGSTIVDLGAGYGRLGFVVGEHFAGVRFVGYELVVARVEEGRRALEKRGYLGIELKVADLGAADFMPAEAEFYFIYDFGTTAAIEKALGDLRQIALRRGITVVGRGRAARDAIERAHPWLSQVISPVHRAHYSIYQSRQ